MVVLSPSFGTLRSSSSSRRAASASSLWNCSGMTFPQNLDIEYVNLNLDFVLFPAHKDIGKIINWCAPVCTYNVEWFSNLCFHGPTCTGADAGH